MLYTYLSERKIKSIELFFSRISRSFNSAKKKKKKKKQ